MVAIPIVEYKCPTTTKGPKDNLPSREKIKKNDQNCCLPN